MKRTCKTGCLRPLAIVCSALAPAVSRAATPLPYFGYYYGDSEAYGHYMDKVVIPSDGTRLQDYSNLILIDIGHYGQADPRRAIIDATNLGYKILLYGADGINRDTPQTWANGFAEFESAVHGYESSIYAVDLVDEPDGNGWNRTQIESVVQQAKTYFNGAMPITVNLDAQTTQAPPRNVDLYSFDYYVNTLQYTTKQQYDAYMAATINAFRTNGPGKSVLMIGSAYSDSSNRLLPTAAQEQWYYNTATTTPEVGGLMWYMLGNPDPPIGYGAINYPAILEQHKQMGLTVVTQKPGLRLDERFTEYANQATVNSAYTGGGAPNLNTSFDHGDNGGKSLAFGTGVQNGTRAISAFDRPGSVDAFVYDLTSTPSQYFGFRILNAAGKSVSIYANGATSDYLVDDEANGVTAFDSGIQSIAHWQKVEFDLDGAGAKVYADSLLVYSSASGWAGGFSKIGFYDRANSNGVGYIDDIRVFQTPETITTWNALGAGNWSSASNWSTGQVPNGADKVAQLFGAITAPQTLVIDQATQLGTLRFNNPNRYVIGGAGSLTMAVTTGSASIDVQAGSQKINVPLTFASNASVNVAAGATLTISNPMTILAGKLVATSGNVIIDAPLILQAGSVLSTPSGVLKLASLPTMASGAMVDLQTSGLTISADDGATMGFVRQMLTHAFANATWAGGGITSSSIVRNQTGIGWIDDTSSQAIDIKFAYYGDADLDGTVSTGDFIALASHFNRAADWSGGDFNYDGVVNALDFNLLASNYGRALPTPLGTTVPEPATVACFLLPLILMRRRREIRDSSCYATRDH